MNDIVGQRSSAEHREMTAMIPWHVNGTLNDRQRRRLEAHLAQCPTCRGDLELERRVYESMTADPGVEYMPGPSLKRLAARLDAMSGESPMAGTSIAAGHVRWRERRWSAIAASAATVGLALGLAMGGRHWPAAAPLTYHTVTTPAPRVPTEVIRAVFARTITLVELQALLDESQLRIVAGPTEAGVYSLAANSARPVTASLEALRKHSTVLFAESVVPSIVPDQE
jgi:anti-sigma factor RsiW